MKFLFFHKTKSRNASKLKCKYKDYKTNFLYKSFQSPISETGMRELGETISESTFYIQFFASLTSDSLANWRSALFLNAKLDKYNLRQYKFHMPVWFSVVPSILPQKVSRNNDISNFLYLDGTILTKSIINYRIIKVALSHTPQFECYHACCYSGLGGVSRMMCAD